MIEKVTIYNRAEAPMTFYPGENTNGIFLKDIEGLDPVKAEFSSVNIPMDDGEDNQTARRGGRDLIMKFGFDESTFGQTVSQLRSALYRHMMSKSKVRVELTDSDFGLVHIRGRVEDFVSPRFVKEPDASVQIRCFLPDFIDVNSTIWNAATTSGTDSSSLEYLGSEETGFLFRMIANRVISSFDIIMTAEGEPSRTLAFADSIIVGDEIQISTVPGQKFARRIRSGVTSSILFGVNPNSNWLKLVPGFNDIRVRVSGSPINYTLEYYKRFGGL